jgi:hypothetical protein
VEPIHLTAKSPAGSLLGRGKVKISGLLPSPYRLECMPRTFSSLSCQKTDDLSVTIKCLIGSHRRRGDADQRVTVIVLVACWTVLGSHCTPVQL